MWHSFVRSFKACTFLSVEGGVILDLGHASKITDQSSRLWPNKEGSNRPNSGSEPAMLGYTFERRIRKELASVMSQTCGKKLCVKSLWNIALR